MPRSSLKTMAVLAALSFCACETILGVEPTVEGTKTGTGGSSDASVGGAAGLAGQDAGTAGTSGAGNQDASGEAAGMSGGGGTSGMGGTGTGGTSGTGGTGGTSGASGTGGVAGTGGSSGAGGQGGTGCLIGGKHYDPDAPNPTKDCQLCKPASNTSDWTQAQTGTACTSDNKDCTTDACDSQGNCAHTPLADLTSCGTGGTRKCYHARCCDSPTATAAAHPTSAKFEGTGFDWFGNALHDPSYAVDNNDYTYLLSQGGSFDYTLTLALTGFGISIPQGRTVVGVEAKIWDCATVDGNMVDEITVGAGGTPGTKTGTAGKCVGPAGSYTTSDALFGGEADLWNDSLSSLPESYSDTGGFTVKYRADASSSNQAAFFKCEVIVHHAQCDP